MNLHSRRAFLQRFERGDGIGGGAEAHVPDDEFGRRRGPLGEALLLGLAGSLLGILLGRILAEGAVGLIADTVNSLYTSSRPAQVAMTWSAALAGTVAGTVVALASAFAPAREAMRASPVSAMVVMPCCPFSGRVAGRILLAGPG